MVIRPELPDTARGVAALPRRPRDSGPQRYSVPETIAGTVIVLLGAPLLHLLIVKRRGLKADATLLLMFALLCALLLSSLSAVSTRGSRSRAYAATSWRACCCTG